MGLISRKFVRINKLNIAIGIFYCFVYNRSYYQTRVFIYNNEGGFRTIWCWI